MSNQNDQLLIVFVKNPILGKVKTRLAKSIGDEKALEIYQFLLQHTAKIMKQVAVDTWVCYSDEVIEDDAFSADFVDKYPQSGSDLGKRMQRAFSAAFQVGYKRVVIIGSDCYEITAEIIQSAFKTLKAYNYVVGPALDGGYYLLGLTKMETSLFENKEWSQDTVLRDTMMELNSLNVAYDLLPDLSDIDELEDMPEELRQEFGLPSS